MLCSFLQAISESALFVLMIEQKRWRTNKEKCVVGSALHRWHDSPYFLLTSRWPVFSPRRYRFMVGGPDRVTILGKSHPAKNRNLSRLVKYWSNATVFIDFSTVFTLLQQQEVPSTCLPHNLPCLVFESSNTFLTYTWLQTGQQHSPSFPHSSPHPVLNLCAINRPFSVFMLTIAGTSSKDILASHCTHPVHQEH